jgi:hypothetical protein
VTDWFSVILSAFIHTHTHTEWKLWTILLLLIRYIYKQKMWLMVTKKNFRQSGSENWWRWPIENCTRCSVQITVHVPDKAYAKSVVNFFYKSADIYLKPHYYSERRRFQLLSSTIYPWTRVVSLLVAYLYELGVFIVALFQFFKKTKVSLVAYDDVPIGFVFESERSGGR